ncbi:MAG TPA: PilZ domain-containing protein [Vicinamibacterales bacterium]|nr:PilZ domain-containing protein [Vicinamibacterales bacterium]
MSEHDKRTVERIPLPSQIAGEVTVFQPMTILDMSERGVQVELGFPLLNDSLHDFRLSLNERSVVVKGRVVYCQIGELREGVVRYRSGVEFIEPSPHALAAIREFVAVHRNPPPRIIDAELA